MSEINWENIYYNLSEFDKYEWSDIDYANNCAENLKNWVPALIERIQKLAKEKNELRKENERLKRQQLNSWPFGTTNPPIDWKKIQTRNGPGVGMHTILPFQVHEPKFTPTPKHSDFYDPTVWSNSIMRDSM